MEDFTRPKNRGAIIWWTPGHFTDPTLLAQGFDSLGLQDYVPKHRTVERALYYAMESTWAGSHAGVKTEVRPVKGRGFEVVRFSPGEAKLDVIHMFSVWIDKVENKGRVMAHSTDGQLLYDMNKPQFSATFQRAATTIGQDTITQMLVSILSMMRGIRLRPNGSVYWLGEDDLPRWDAVTNAVYVASGAQHVSRVIRHEVDPEAAMAVLDGLRTQVKDEAKELQEAVDSGTLGERALNTKSARLKQLLTLVGYYEAKFDTSLADLKTTLDVVADAALYAVQQIAIAKQKGN